MGFSKGSTSTFIVERKMYLKPEDYAYLESRMYIANRMYNTGVKHYRWVLNTFHSDTNFISAFENVRSVKVCVLMEHYHSHIDLIKVGIEQRNYNRAKPHHSGFPPKS